MRHAEGSLLTDRFFGHQLGDRDAGGAGGSITTTLPGQTSGEGNVVWLRSFSILASPYMHSGSFQPEPVCIPVPFGSGEATGTSKPARHPGLDRIPTLVAQCTEFAGLLVHH